MSSRRTKPQPLSDIEIRQIAADIAAGRPPMVWFTAAAVGVPEGRSGKVVALGDPAEGDFLQVRPTGSKDELSFSPTEVTLTKPARRTAAPAATKQTAKKTTARRKDTAVSMPSTVNPAPPNPEPVKPAVAEQGSAPQPTPAADSPAPKPAAKPAPAPAKPPQKSAAARKSKTGPEVTVTLSGTADGEWTVEVVHGKKRTRGLSVPGATVAQAAKLLHPEVAEVVDSVLESVRSSQRAKVEQLQAELEQARRVLDDLAG